MRAPFFLLTFVAFLGTAASAFPVSLVCEGNIRIVQSGSQSDGGTFRLLLELNQNGSFVGRFDPVNATFAGKLATLSQYYMLTAAVDGWVGNVETRSEQNIQIDRNSGRYIGQYTSWSSATGFNYEQDYDGTCFLNTEIPKF